MRMEEGIVEVIHKQKKGICIYRPQWDQSSALLYSRCVFVYVCRAFKSVKIHWIFTKEDILYNTHYDGLSPPFEMRVVEISRS